MQFEQPLDVVLDSPSKIRILRFFCQKGGEWNGRRLANEVGISPATAHKALRELQTATLLDFRKIGNNFVYSLRDHQYLVRRAFKPLFQEERSARQHLFERLKTQLSGTLRSQIETAVVYGSLARSQEHPTSDVDLLILVKSESAKGKVQEALDSFWESILREFGNDLSLYINTVAEARAKYRQRLPLFEDILKNHQLILGKPLQEVLHD